MRGEEAVRTGRDVEELTQPRFIGEVVTRWLKHEGDDRLMELQKKFAFVDSHGNTWVAPKGFIFDGTTIPRALWTVFGDPFIGDYRRAAVIHDLLCTPRCAKCRRLTADRGKNAEPRYTCHIHGETKLLYRVSSDDAARIMFEGMSADGLSETRARIISRTVGSWGPQFARSETKPAA
jgi:hypothetical protein